MIISFMAYFFLLLGVMVMDMGKMVLNLYYGYGMESCGYMGLSCGQNRIACGYMVHRKNKSMDFSENDGELRIFEGRLRIYGAILRIKLINSRIYITSKKVPGAIYIGAFFIFNRIFPIRI